MTDWRRIAILAACLAGAPPGEARDIHYGAVTDPEVLECDELYWRGNTRESSLCYAGLLRADVTPAVKAEASWALNNLKQANEWFRAAMDDAPDDYATKVRWGDLFAASHQDGEAMNIYREVLDADPNNAFALLGAARVLVGGFQDEANAYLEPLIDGLAYDDGALLGAWLLIARVSLEAGNHDEAEAALREAEALVERHGFPPLDVYALRASLDLLNNVEDSAWTERSLAYNPHWGRIYSLPAHFYVITRRYREAIDLYQNAIDIEPTLASAHEEIGINLSRDNQLTRARQHLERAYELDPFSPRAVNSLRLMDSFGKFRVVQEMPDAAGDVPVVLRLHQDEAEAIAPYATDLVRDSIRAFTDRYGFRLREPVVVEMYPDHEDFAVRTAGMPGLGILGATFGYVIAMDSPSGRPPQEFQWGTTLWHEMAHVFTLEATNHLVPRWYSEGISVFEEWRTGPNPGIRIPMSVYDAMQEDRFLPIADLDEGFVRPTYDGQVIVSYMQAGLVCDFIDRRFGAAALREMLVAFRDGQKTDAAIRSVTGLEPDDFDEEFADFVAAGHGHVLDNLQGWHHRQAEIGARLEAGKWREVVEMATEQTRLIPGYVEPDSPWLALARAYEELGEQQQALAALQIFRNRGGYDPAALKRLGRWLAEAGRQSDAIAAFQGVMMVDPLDVELHGELGDLLLDAGRAGDALQEYRIALALEPHDMATAWYRLARAEHALGNTERSQAHVLQALDIAPNFRAAQRLLLEIAEGGDN